MPVEKFIADSNKAAKTEHLSALFAASIRKVGYDKFVYCRMAAASADGGATEHGLAGNYPEDWMRHYRNNNYIAYDPRRRQAKRTGSPFTWESLKHGADADKRGVAILHEAEEAGLHSGIIVPLHHPGGRVSGMGIASDAPHDGARNPDVLSKLHMLVLQFDVAYARLEGAASPRAVSLSPKERETLLWCARGKSNTDIAAIMGCSANTVKFHLGNIYRKLDAGNKMLAVLKASELGLIDASCPADDAARACLLP
jgi:LuxR family transcriptional activator of conjugal transfer of Ti plasmids